MNTLASAIFIVPGSALAILSGCWGLEMIEENPGPGWVLLTIGVSYPPELSFMTGTAMNA
jgi:hypothetical protein